MPDATPAQELREAARLMRERAKEAEQAGYDSDHPGKPWCPEWTYTAVRHVQRNCDIECSEHEWGTEKEGECNRWGRYAGYHIAGMHPGVALAVADWLDQYVGWIEGAVVWETPECTHDDGPCRCARQPGWYHGECDGFIGDDCTCFGKALAVARTFLGTKEATGA